MLPILPIFIRAVHSSMTGLSATEADNSCCKIAEISLAGVVFLLGLRRSALDDTLRRSWPVFVGTICRDVPGFVADETDY